MSFLKWLLTRRREKAEEEAALARARMDAVRAGDEPEKSQSDVVGEGLDKFPPGT